MARCTRLAGLALSLCCTSAPLPAGAQWVEDGVPVTTAPGPQRGPAMVTDGQGGVFIAWQNDDLPRGVFLQRYGTDGRPAAGWPTGGIPIPSSCPTELYGIVSDHAGGVLIGYRDCAFQVPFRVQRITASGSIAPGWPAEGLPLASLNYSPIPAGVLTDGAGGLFACWRHYYPTEDGHGIPYWVTDYFVQRILPTGDVAAGWPAEGQAIYRYAIEISTLVIADRRGGLLIGVTTTGLSGLSGAGSVLRLNESGNNDYWVNMSCPTNNAEVRQVVQLYPDVSGGAIVPIREHTRGAGELIHTTSRKLDELGNLVGNWAPSCQPLPGAVQGAQQIVTDGGSGTFFAWSDTRNSSEPDIYAVRRDAAGLPAPGWSPTGEPACIAPGSQRDLRMIPDGLGGAITAWVDTRSGTNSLDLYAQRLGPDGPGVVGWPAAGVPICTAPGDQKELGLIPDGVGGAYVCWEDYRNGASDIYLHRIGPGGPVPVQISVARTEVSSDRVRIEWHLGGSVPGTIPVSRRESDGEWTEQGLLLPDGTGRIEHVDHTVRPGARYGYRLEFPSRDRREFGGEVWVDVPSPAFRLGSPSPNPSASGWSVPLALLGSSAATLEVIDPQGRIVLTRDLRSLGIGQHQIRLHHASALPAGVYTLRLTEADRTATARGVILR